MYTLNKLNIFIFVRSFENKKMAMSEKETTSG